MSQPLLGRCKFPGCDYALFVAPEDVKNLRKAGGFNSVRQPGVAYLVGKEGVFARCDKHRIFKLRQIEGTYSPDHKCDARCLKARGWKCRCSCGGANHGRGYAVVHTAHEEKEERLLGEVGRCITGHVKVTRKIAGNNTTIYNFRTLDDTAKLVWFVPVTADPDLQEREVYSIRARVKRHEDDPTYGKSTVVVYVEASPPGQD